MVALALICVGTPAFPAGVPAIFGPGVKIFALALPLGDSDSSEKFNRGKGGMTYFRLLYRWLTKNGRPDDDLIQEGSLENFHPLVLSNLSAHADHGKPLRQAIVLFKGHGTRAGIGSAAACKAGYSRKDGDFSEWEAVRDFLIDVRVKMDQINRDARLIVITDACYGGQLWNRLKEADDRMHSVAFLAGAPSDSEGDASFFLKLRGVLERKSATGETFSWETVYRSLSIDYDDWFWDEGGKTKSWISAFYADSGDVELRSYSPAALPRRR